MSDDFSLRPLFGLLALICAGLLAYAYYAQFVLLLNPCPLCIFQRIAFIAVFVISAIGFLHGPGRTGRKVYGLLCVIAAGAGAGVAGWHVWIQSQPADENIACGAMSLDYMLEIFSYQETITRAFQGTGNCADIDWAFLGLSMPAWTLVIFLAIIVGAILALRRDRPRDSWRF